MQAERDVEIRRWADYVRTHPDWKKQHTDFVNAQYSKQAEFVKQLRNTENGIEKLRKLGYEKTI